MVGERRERDMESMITESCKSLVSTFACSSSSSAWEGAKEGFLGTLRRSSTNNKEGCNAAMVSSLLLRFLVLNPGLPDPVQDAIAHAISQCCGSSPIASTLAFFYPPSTRILVQEVEFTEGGVGWKVWGSALVLGGRLIGLQGDISGKRVLELGSGCGLCGLLASKLGACEVLLTDCVPKILSNLCYNAKLNLLPLKQLGSNQNDLEVALDENTPSVSVCWLDWVEDSCLGEGHLQGNYYDKEDMGEFAKLDRDDQFDCVLGSDVIYEKQNLPALAVVIHSHLRMNGRALLVCPIREKTALSLFLDELHKLGMAAGVEYIEEEEWESCKAVVVSSEKFFDHEATMHGVDHYEGGIAAISVVHA